MACFVSTGTEGPMMGTPSRRNPPPPRRSDSDAQMKVTCRRTTHRIGLHQICDVNHGRRMRVYRVG